MKTHSMNRKTKNLILTAMFVALIAVGAFIRIPVPMVPFTLQVQFALLAGLLLGGKSGCLSVCTYITLGLIGLPVFTQGGGPGYIFQPSFGYIIGFAVGSYVAGIIANKKQKPSYRRILTANVVGIAVVYLCGMVYYYLISKYYIGNPIGLFALFVYCFLLTIPGDLLLCVLGSLLAKRLIPLIQSERI